MALRNSVMSILYWPAMALEFCPWDFRRKCEVVLQGPSRDPTCLLCLLRPTGVLPLCHRKAQWKEHGDLNRTAVTPASPFICCTVWQALEERKMRCVMNFYLPYPLANVCGHRVSANGIQLQSMRDASVCLTQCHALLRAAAESPAALQ